MNQIPTAEQYVKSFTIKYGMYDEWLKDVMIGFTKLHVEAALEAAGNIADAWENSGELKPEILNAYNLNDIK